MLKGSKCMFQMKRRWGHQGHFYYLLINSQYCPHFKGITKSLVIRRYSVATRIMSMISLFSIWFLFTKNRFEMNDKITEEKTRRLELIRNCNYSFDDQKICAGVLFEFIWTNRKGSQNQRIFNQHPTTSNNNINWSHRTTEHEHGKKIRIKCNVCVCYDEKIALPHTLIVPFHTIFLLE